MRVEQLIGANLDYWVARAEGLEARIVRISHDAEAWNQCVAAGRLGDYQYTPSTTWRHGGPIIDRERMNFATFGTGPAGESGQPPIVAIPQEGRRAMEGPTHLVAAMRAHVASKFGDEVPDEVEA
jgi:hypothetical protein